MSRFIEAMDEEIRSLRQALEADIRFRRLQELQRIRASVYATEGGIPASGLSPVPAIDGVPPHMRGAPPTRKPSAERQRAIDAAHAFLRGKIEPTPIKVVYNHLVGLGITIGGKDPSSNLSAMLSQDGRFLANGRSGWTLREEAEEEEQEEKEYAPSPDDQRDAQLMRDLEASLGRERLSDD